MDGKDFVLRIDSVLKEKKLKRLAVAEAVSVTTQAFTNWAVRGSMPAADTALKHQKIVVNCFCTLQCVFVCFS